VRPDGSEYEGKPKKMNPGERFYLWDFADDHIHPCEIHIAGDELCAACREWLTYKGLPYPRKCPCGGLIHYVCSWEETMDDSYQIDTEQCDQCGQKDYSLEEK
jgi:hypothetical protein